jgi:hypothetical protein
MIATIKFFSEVHYLAVFVAALAYFILGALWYSVLFGKFWAKGIEEMGIKMSKPDQGKMGMMMLKSFTANLLCSFAMAYFIHIAGAYSLESGVKLGIVGGCGLTLSSQLMVANWQGTKPGVMIVDAGYQILGVLLVSVIIAVWH